MRDQFFIFKKSAQNYKPEEIQRALEYCAGRELFYATDFKDTLTYFQNLEPPAYINEEFKLPPKYSLVTAQERDVGEYCKIYNNQGENIK
jgi:hypothetical protein